MSRRRSTGRWTSPPSACRRAPSASPGPRSIRATATSTSSLDLPDEMRPRGPMTIPVSIANLKPGEEAYVTVAAVDVGILNLTNFKAPAPDDWYFGQRKLGMEIRDLYGLLIDRTQGVPGAVRSGGDGGMTRLQGAAADPEAARLLFRHRRGRRRRQGVGHLRPARLQRHRAGHGHGLDEGRRRPCRQGRLRPRSGGGDRVASRASSPIGDTSRLLVEINNVSGRGRRLSRCRSPPATASASPTRDAERTVTLAEKQRVVASTSPLDGNGDRRLRRRRRPHRARPARPGRRT